MSITEDTDQKPYRLYCVVVPVAGTPMPTITWKFNGEVLKSSTEIAQSYNGRNAKLMFLEVFPDDAGQYECVAKNNSGEVTTSAQLTVIGTKTSVPSCSVPGSLFLGTG